MVTVFIGFLLLLGVGVIFAILSTTKGVCVDKWSNMVLIIGLSGDLVIFRVKQRDKRGAPPPTPPGVFSSGGKDTKTPFRNPGF